MENNSDRGQWSRKMGFILAAVGSAIGLGNIWRYPYLAYANGGGAFLVPYFFALFTAGIPLMILEYSFGHKFKGSTPMAIARANKKWEWLGWWPSVNSMVILVYYSVILGWAVNYLIYSFTLAWGEDTKGFFFGKFLGLTDGVWNLGGIQWPIFLSMAAIWFINWSVCYRGVSGGIERLNRILIPTLGVIMVILVIRGLTLPGAVIGLNKLLTPDWSMVMKPSVWIAAYGQIFFSLSLAMGVMITYSSYLPKKTDVVNSAFMTCFANCGFEFLAAIGVFSVLGYMAFTLNVPVDQVAGQSVGLAFVVFPKAISMMPGIFKVVFGVLFFSCLVFAGLTSSVSMVEAFSSAVIDKTGVDRKKVVSWASGVGFVVSSIFATGAGLYILDIVDHFINSYGTVVIGMMEAVFVGWIFGAWRIREHANAISHYPVGRWWEIMIKYVTPAVLVYMLFNNLIGELKAPYEGYPVSALLILGWMVAVGTIVAGFVLSSSKWKEGALLVPEDALPSKEVPKS